MIHLRKGRDKENCCWKLPKVVMKLDVFRCVLAVTLSILVEAKPRAASQTVWIWQRPYCCGHFWTILSDGRQECQTLDCIDSAIVLMAMQKFFEIIAERI